MSIYETVIIATGADDIQRESEHFSEEGPRAYAHFIAALHWEFTQSIQAGHTKCYSILCFELESDD